MSRANTYHRERSITKRCGSLAVVYRPIAELKLDPDNPRLHSLQQIQKIERSIRTFGFLFPVLTNSDGQVIAGHGRILAAQGMGMNEVPVIMVDHLTETQARALAITDNRLTEIGTWDGRLLAQQLKALSEVELNFDVEVTGFGMTEIDLMIEGLEPAIQGGQDPGDVLPEVSEQVPVSRTADVWTLDRHRVVCNDALEESSFALLLQSRQAAMVFADPPYNVPIDGHATGLGRIQHREFQMASGEMTAREFRNFLSQVFDNLADYSSDGSLHYLCMDWRHMAELLAAGRHAYSKLMNVCIWTKDNAGMGTFYRSQHEMVFVFKNGHGIHRNNVQLGQFGRYRSNVWRYPGVNSFSRKTDEGNLLELHPTVKPVALVADAILDCTARKDIVLDPFLGSGTTIIAAERTGRTCYGIEMDPLYVDTAIRRWQKFTGGCAVHAQSGKTFNELQQEVRNG